MFKLQILVSVFNLFRNGCRDFRGPRAPETSALVTDVDARFLQMVTLHGKDYLKPKEPVVSKGQPRCIHHVTYRSSWQH